MGIHNLQTQFRLLDAIVHTRYLQFFYLQTSELFNTKIFTHWPSLRSDPFVIRYVDTLHTMFRRSSLVIVTVTLCIVYWQIYHVLSQSYRIYYIYFGIENILYKEIFFFKFVMTNSNYIKQSFLSYLFIFVSIIRI